MGTAADTNQEIRMDYAVLDLGSEKLVARYVGPAEWMAFNESVLPGDVRQHRIDPMDVGSDHDVFRVLRPTRPTRSLP